jgi:hypothetical protein
VLVQNSASSIFEYADESGVSSLISLLAGFCLSHKPEMRRESCWMMQTFVEVRECLSLSKCDGSG